MFLKDELVTPPCGWNSYDYYDTTVTEDEVKANADFMAKHLKKYGYEYVVVDIEWYSNDAGTRRDEHQYIPFGDDEIDEYGRFQPSKERFPSSADGTGFTKLAKYVHDLGLKFGIHIMRGIPRIAASNHMPIYGTDTVASEAADPSSICGWNPDMYGVRNNEYGQAYYDSIISMYADWGVDFIKCDDICDSWMYRNDGFNGWFETTMLRKAIEKQKRPIVLSLSPGPAHIDRAWKYGKDANMWRITDDFWDNWELLKNMFMRCEMWQDHVYAGNYPDCDMIPIGKLGKGFGEERDSRFTSDEKKTMMTLWCMFKSPLMIGGELTKLNEEDLKVLTKKEILDLLGENRVGNQVCRSEELAIWVNYDKDTKEEVFAIFNLSDDEKDVTLDVKGEKARELWENKEYVVAENKLRAKVNPHAVKVFAIS